MMKIWHAYTLFIHWFTCCLLCVETYFPHPSANTLSRITYAFRTLVWFYCKAPKAPIDWSNFSDGSSNSVQGLVPKNYKKRSRLGQQTEQTDRAGVLHSGFSFLDIITACKLNSFNVQGDCSIFWTLSISSCKLLLKELYGEIGQMLSNLQCVYAFWSPSAH